VEREPTNELGQQHPSADERNVAGGIDKAPAEVVRANVPQGQPDKSEPPVHPRLAGMLRDNGPEAAHAVPEPDAIRPDSSPEWRELFKQVRMAVDRLRE